MLELRREQEAALLQAASTCAEDVKAARAAAEAAQIERSAAQEQVVFLKTQLQYALQVGHMKVALLLGTRSCMAASLICVVVSACGTSAAPASCARLCCTHTLLRVSHAGHELRKKLLTVCIASTCRRLIVMLQSYSSSCRVQQPRPHRCAAHCSQQAKGSASMSSWLGS